MIRLGVNIDHVATLRQARGEHYPDPVEAGLLSLRSGADNLTFHLREDRRHIQDSDVRLLNQMVQSPLNFELAFSEDIIELALNIKPHSVTFVPERRQELTTEGGLAFAGNERRFREAIELTSKAGILVSLFIEPSNEAVDCALQCGAKAVEFHTGNFCKAIAEARSTGQLKTIVENFKKVCDYAKKRSVQVHVGHGLNYSNAHFLQHIDCIEEANIGHAIISRAIFTGLPEAVSTMKKLLNDGSLKPHL